MRPLRCPRCEPVDIAHDGRRAFVLMPAEHYDWMQAANRRAHRTSNTTSVVIDTVWRTKMDPEQAALDELLK